MPDITAELVRKMTLRSVKDVPTNIWFTVEIVPNVGCSTFDLTVTVRDPWTYEPISSCKPNMDHFPTGDDYAFMIAHILKMAHPSIICTYGYYPMDKRIIIEYIEEAIPWENKKEENKHMRFTKVIVNGPATIAWVTTGRNPAKKVIIKKADGDIYDLEKAMLLCWAKSWFSDDTDFHKWFRTNMKMFKEAYNEAHPDIDELDVALNGKVIADGINATLDRMSQRIHEYSERINKRYAELAEKKEPMYGDDVVELFKATFNATEVQEPGAPWTWDEISFLHRHYSSKSTKSIAMALGRSEYAVRSKAKRLGIKKRGNTHDA